MHKSSAPDPVKWKICLDVGPCWIRTINYGPWWYRTIYILSYLLAMTWHTYLHTYIHTYIHTYFLSFLRKLDKNDKLTHRQKKVYKKCQGVIFKAWEKYQNGDISAKGLLNSFLCLCSKHSQHSRHSSGVN